MPGHTRPSSRARAPAWKRDSAPRTSISSAGEIACEDRDPQAEAERAIAGGTEHRTATEVAAALRLTDADPSRLEG